MSKISIIVATGKNREIGAENKLLWTIPEELKRFKEITTGHPIIMGRKTHESIGRILPNRTNIIVTRDSNYKVEGAVVVHSLEEAISYASSLRGAERRGNLTDKVSPASQEIASPSATRPLHLQSRNEGVGKEDENEIFVIGGGQIFEQALPIADKLYVTLVDAEFPEADSFFPEYEDKFTKKVFELDQESSGYKYKFLEFEC